MLQSRLKVPARWPRLVTQKANVGIKLNYIENRLYKYRIRVISEIVAPGSKYKGGGDGRGRRCMRIIGVTAWI